MPPRTSKRLRSTGAGATNARKSAPELSTPSQKASAPKALGRTISLMIGIPNTLRTNETTDLPVELFYEILSYFEAVPFDVMPPANSDFYLRDSDSLGRQDALRTLSQISRSWRAFFLPLAWESIELAAMRTGKGPWFKQTAEGLIKTGKRLSETPEISQYVRNIRVVITQSSIDKAMPAFVSALEACTNLKTVSVFFAHKSTTQKFKDAFEGMTFSSIEALVLPKQAHAIVKACPNLKKVFCTRGDGSQIFNTLIKGLGQHLELIAGVRFEDWKKLAKAAPKLQEIRTSFNGQLDTLKEFKCLRRLTFNLYGSEENAELHIRETLLPRLKEFLSDCTVTVKPESNYWYFNDATWTKTYYIPAKA